ncbi:MAG: C4-type zinc ribbon domain-containing protein [Vicinamibacterales bacterium]
MLPALTSLIALQDVSARAEDARRRIAEAPGRIQALDQQLAGTLQALEAAKAALAESQAARRALEGECGVVQQRVSKYKDQLMEAKDNRQFHALQHEIATFTTEVERIEGLIIEKMVELDELGAKVKATEAALAKDRQTVAAQKAAIEAETAQLTQALEAMSAERAAIAASVPAPALTTFETMFRARKHLAVVKVVDGLCEGCRVRLRPHLLNQLRAGDQIIQCESCQRIVYYVPPPPKAEAEPATPPPAAGS